MKRLTIVTLILGFSAIGCSGQFWGGTATGALGTGSGYEYNLNRQMKRVEDDYKAGKINEQEYNIRKDQIQRDSLLQ